MGSLAEVNVAPTQYRVQVRALDGHWIVAATSFLGLLGASAWAIDAFTEAEVEVRVQQGGGNLWRTCWAGTPSPAMESAR